MTAMTPTHGEAVLAAVAGPDRRRSTLPRLGLGCAAFGNLYAPVADGEAAATLRGAWEAGIHYFDTAPYYGHGLSEARLGRFLRGLEGAPALVSSKVGRSLRAATPGELAPDTGFVDAAPFVPYFDYGRDAVLAQVEGSLSRLGFARLEVAFVHDIGARTHGGNHRAVFKAALDGAFPTLHALKGQGVVGGVGLGVNEVEVALETLDRASLDVLLLAGRYTLLDHELALERLLPLCRERGVDVVIGGPFNSGVLAGGGHYDYGAVPPATMLRVERLRSVCAAHGVSLAAAALQFPLRHPAVVSVIPGARSPREVAEAAANMAAPAPEALWRDLADAGLLPRAVANPSA